MDEITQFLTTKDLAELLRTTPETVRYWAWRGEGPKSFKTGRRRLYDRRDVEAWIADRQREASAAGATSA